MIYLLIIFIIILFIYKKEFYNTQFQHQRFPIFLYLLFSLLAGLRFEIGDDTLHYYSFFKELFTLDNINKSFIEDHRFQPLSIYFISLCKTINSNFAFLQLVHAFLINYILFSFVKNNTKYVYLSLLIYFITNYLEFNTEILRESIAVCITLLSYNALKNNKIVKYILFSALAICFHISSVIVLIFPLLINVKYSHLSFTALSIVSAILPILYLQFPYFDYLVSLFLGDSEYLASYAIQEVNEGFNFNYYVGHLIHYLVVPLGFVFVIRKYQFKSSKFIGFIYAYIFLQMLGMFSYGFYRFANYFAPFIWVMYADAIHVILRKVNFSFRFILLLIIIFILLYLSQAKLLSLDNVGNGMYVYERYFPYKSILFNGNYK